MGLAHLTGVYAINLWLQGLGFYTDQITKFVKKYSVLIFFFKSKQLVTCIII